MASGYPLHLIGLSGFGASPAQIQAGRRRLVTILAFMSFVLYCAGAADEDWIAGDLEIQLPNNVADKFPGVSAMFNVGSGASIQRTFKMGLTKATTTGQAVLSYWSTDDPFSVQTSVDANYPLADFITFFNYGTSSGNGFFGTASPVNYSSFQATLGLVVFAAVLQGILYFVLVAVMYEVPIISTYKHTMLIARILAPSIALFSLIGIIVFGTSGSLTNLCAGLSPDSKYLGQPCDYGNGFGCTVTAFIFSVFQSLSLWLWVSPEPAQKYEFGTKAGYEPSSGFIGSNFNGAATGSTDAAGGFQSSTSAVSVGGYQDIAA